jgi:hypothetical protein
LTDLNLLLVLILTFFVTRISPRGHVLDAFAVALNSSTGGAQLASLREDLIVEQVHQFLLLCRRNIRNVMRHKDVS